MAFSFAIYVSIVGSLGLLSRPRLAEWAVVFGNTVTADGQPSPRLKARLDAAAALFERGGVQHILVSGGIEQPGDLDEAAVMAAYLLRVGIPAGAVVQDAAGIDSFETARHTASLVPTDAGVVVVTQWFHTPRAMLAMRRFGVQPVSADWPAWFEARDLYSLLREAVGLPFYAVRSRAEKAGA